MGKKDKKNDKEKTTPDDAARAEAEMEAEQHLEPASEELELVEEIEEEVEEEVEDEIDSEDMEPELVADTDDGEVILTDAEGNRYCRSKDCDQIAVVDTYCRYHYLMFWRRIQNRKKILLDGKLERYVEELTSRYPDKFLEMIRKDLRTEKDFVAAIQELELDESSLDNEYEEDTQSFIDEVRGMGGGEAESVEDDF